MTYHADTYGLDNALAMARSGGEVLLSGGRTYDHKGLDLDRACNLTVRSTGGRAIVRYTGADECGVSLRSAKRFVSEGADWTYSNPAFTGDLIRFGHADTSDAMHCAFRDGTLQGDGATGARSLVDVSLSLFTEFTSVCFLHAERAVRRSEYANVTRFDGCMFARTASKPVLNPGEAWRFGSCTFEPLLPADPRQWFGRAGAVESEPGQYARGLTFDCCWFGDTAEPGGSWLDVLALGLRIQGGMMGAAGTDGEASVRLQPGCEGVEVAAVRFEGGHIGVEVPRPYVRGLAFRGCSFGPSMHLAFKGLRNALDATAASNHNFRYT